MAHSLSQFITDRARSRFKALLAEIDGITDMDALRYSDPNWPDHRWGVGQNGSIAGIVYHVAAWKQMTLPMFDTGGRPLTRDEFDEASAPDPSDWPAIVEWLHEVGNAWNQRLLSLTSEEWGTTRDWEGNAVPISSFIVEMLEHDVQHASQIEYLKQRCAADSASLE